MPCHWRGLCAAWWFACGMLICLKFIEHSNLPSFHPSNPATELDATPPTRRALAIQVSSFSQANHTPKQPIQVQRLNPATSSLAAGVDSSRSHTPRPQVTHGGTVHPTQVLIAQTEIV